MSRTRSPETEIRRLRTVIRNGIATAERLQAEFHASSTLGLSMLKDWRRSAEDAVRPKPRRSPRSARRDAR